MRLLRAGPAARPSAEAFRFDDLAPSGQLHTPDNLLIFPDNFYDATAAIAAVGAFPALRTMVFEAQEQLS